MELCHDLVVAALAARPRPWKPSKPPETDSWFPKIRGPFGRKYKKDHITLVSILGPLVYGNSHVITVPSLLATLSESSGKRSSGEHRIHVFRRTVHR